jgi:uncharacterized protein YrzB (UPF0473 family)
MENKTNKITLLNEKGEEKEYEVLFTFDSDETKKNYIVYTDHKKDPDGKEMVYASIYDESGKDNSLKPITSDKEWQVIENILNSIEQKVNNSQGEK